MNLLDSLARRRQFRFVPLTFDVTFHGNGGMTDNGEQLVTLRIPAGTRWNNINKPSFSLTSLLRPQNGFTAVQGDDDTLIDSGYIVYQDIDVYASYTAVEFGVVTQDGEILSFLSWVDKYGNHYRAGDLYDPIYVEADKAHLIRFVYFKEGDIAKMVLLLPDKSLTGVYANANTIGMRGLDIQELSVQKNTNLPIIFAKQTYPLYPRNFFDPDTWNDNPPEIFYSIDQYVYPDKIKNNILQDYNGKETFYKLLQTVQGETDSGGTVGSPFLESIAGFSIPGLIAQGDFYLPSPSQFAIIKSNMNRFINIITQINLFLNTPSAVDVNSTPTIWFTDMYTNYYDFNIWTNFFKNNNTDWYFSSGLVEDTSCYNTYPAITIKEKTFNLVAITTDTFEPKALPGPFNYYSFFVIADAEHLF
jgi:hypothetical protein